MKQPGAITFLQITDWLNVHLSVELQVLVARDFSFSLMAAVP